MTESILAIVAVLLALFAWFVKRKRAPTLPEQLDDIYAQFEDSIESVHELRKKGEHDKAEEMLTRMRDRARAERLRE